VSGIDTLRAALEAAISAERLARLDVSETVAAMAETGAVLYQARANDIRAGIDYDVAKHALELASSEVRRLSVAVTSANASVTKTVN
jgi:hypothetical protein